MSCVNKHNSDVIDFNPLSSFNYRSITGLDILRMLAFRFGVFPTADNEQELLAQAPDIKIIYTMESK